MIVLEVNGLFQRSLLQPAPQLRVAPADLVHRQPDGPRSRAGKNEYAPVLLTDVIRLRTQVGQPLGNFPGPFLCFLRRASPEDFALAPLVIDDLVRVVGFLAGLACAGVLAVFFAGLGR